MNNGIKKTLASASRHNTRSSQFKCSNKVNKKHLKINHEIEISKYLYVNSQLTIIKAIYIASEPFSNKNCEKVINM